MNEQQPQTQIIRKFRLEKGLSLAELGRRIGVSRSAVSMWETGRQNISRDNFAKLAKALDVDEAKLFGMIYGDPVVSAKEKAANLDESLEIARRLLVGSAYETYQIFSKQGLKRLIKRLTDDLNDVSARLDE